MHAQNFGHTLPGHCSSSTSPARATLKGPARPFEVYNYDLLGLDPVGDGPQVTCMTADDWCLAQRTDPVLSLMIARM